MFKPTRSKSKSLALACTSISAIAFAQLAATAAARAADQPDAVADNAAGGAANSFGVGIETVVVTGARFNPNNAPAKASLDTTEPQTIINKNYIQDSISPTADYVTILGIVPSLTGFSINGPGMSDGNVKNTLRGLQDGNFAMLYDGIPFGDTNGPTHHSESYFPSSTIGGIDVDRGPGNAGNLGAATYGGTINIYSEGLEDDFHARQTFTYGSWNTFNINTNVQSGDLDLGMGAPTKVMANFQYTGSEGYLTLQNTIHENDLIKIEQDLGSDWSLTFLENHNVLLQHVSDNNGATAGQVLTFGKPYALEGTISDLPDYFGFNEQHKQTDIDYLRLRGSVNGVLIDDQVYTYAYVNKTVTATNITQNFAQAQLQLTAPGDAPDVLSPSGVGTSTAVNGVGGTAYPNDVQAYTKLNAYRVWGNIFRVSDNFDAFGIPVEARVGLWAEGQATERQRVYFDATRCAAAGCKPYNGALTYYDTSNTQANGNVAPLAGVPLGVGYLEHTSWSQYEPFLELEIKPTDDLTITPGVKYVYWNHEINPNSIVAPKGKPPAVYSSLSPNDNFITTRTLPFFTANYKIEPNWSAYFQYANGIYVPDISAFEFDTTITSFPKPQTTTNYQFGSVFYADNLTADADIYYIDSKNTIEFVDCGTVGGTKNDNCAINAGPVIYEGIEGEMTYTFDENQFEGLFDGLAFFANGSLNSARVHVDPGDAGSLGPAYQDKQAPFWTAAGGLIYKDHGWKLSLIDKLTGQQYEDSPGNRIDTAGNPIWKTTGAGFATSIANPAYNGHPFYKIGAFNMLDFTGSYDISGLLGCDDSSWELGAGVYNILDERDIAAMTLNDTVTKQKAFKAPPGLTPPIGTSAENLASRGSSFDQYYFMPERSFQLTLKVRF